MDIGNFLSSISTVAILALVATVLILLFELRHLFFHKKAAANPEIPDFDGNIHMAPEHATLIDVDKIENGVNKKLIFLLLIIMAILVVIVIGGFLYGKKKATPRRQVMPEPTVIPTEIIEIDRISPTSPFGEVVEIPFDLSGTPKQVTNTPKVNPTQSSIVSEDIVNTAISPTTPIGVSTIALATIASTQSARATNVDANPSLPASGGFSYFALIALVPFLLVALAIIL